MPAGYSLHVGLDFVDTHIIGYNPARGASAAADAMAAIARARAFQESILIVNRDATLSGVTAAFTRLASRLRDDDMLFLSIAGHGDVHPRGRDPGGHVNRAFFLFDHFWVDDEIYRLLAGIAARARVIVVAECCNSGTIHGGLFAERRDHGRNDPTVRAPLLKVRPARPRVTANVLLLAASPDNRAALVAEPDRRLAPFTDALVASVNDATSYRDLRERIQPLAMDRGNPAPVLNEALVTAPSFADEQPFSIGGA